MLLLSLIKTAECGSLLNEFTNMRTKSTEFRGLAHILALAEYLLTLQFCKELSFHDMNRASRQKLKAGARKVASDNWWQDFKCLLKLSDREEA